MTKSWIPLAIAALLASCSSRPDSQKVAEAAKKPELLMVQVAAAETRRVDQAISITGSLSPDESANLSAEVAGRVTAIHADFGQSVHKGEVLAEINPQEYQIAVDRSKAALAQALARVGLTRDQENTPPESTPAMRQSQAQMDDAKFKFDNAAKLVQSGDISQERYTELEKAYRARQAGLEMLRDEMRSQWAQVDSLRAELRLAEKRLNDTQVRAPFDGAVMQKMVSVGQYMKENTPILMLVKSDPLRLRAEIPETGSAEVRVGTTLSFTTDAIPATEFQAVVRELNPSLDSKSRVLEAEARLTKSDSRLRPGMFVQVQLTTRHATEIVVVPKQALYTVAGLQKIFLIRSGKVVEVRVPPGQEINGFIEVPSDLVKPGDSVAVSNLPVLVNSAEVRVQNAKAS
jgi:RND family efflux transporter MFP subunit